ncbi:MAG TPA: hypothetical protein PKE06_20000 [Flavilitoribacter sp.]|nr:hypothetical protein [Flavilitoribacter sp.]HMQ89982.1 hypothetical protein [Flavilitoribacter sp.]
MTPSKKVFALILAFAALVPVFNPGCVPPKCEQIGCGLHGHCDHGFCHCDEGWDGPACTTEITPIRICLKKVTVTLFPENLEKGTAKKGSAGGQQLDLMLRIRRLNSPLSPFFDGIDEQDFGGVMANHNSLLPAVFTLESGVDGCLTAPAKPYSIAVYSDDGSGSYGAGDLLLGAITFTPYLKGQAFPSLIVLDNQDVKFEIEVSYLFP